MRPRISTSGCGLVAWLEETQIHLPLKAVECRFQVLGPVVDVQIDQIFHQSARRPLDVTYSFPLPSKAAVYRCEMIVNQRTIRARVLEQEAARRAATLKKTEGCRTALVEIGAQESLHSLIGQCPAGRRPRHPVRIHRGARRVEGRAGIADSVYSGRALYSRQAAPPLKLGPGLRR
jgi:Vault protein inter-alpha-trypsin domain